MLTLVVIISRVVVSFPETVSCVHPIDDQAVNYQYTQWSTSDDKTVTPSVLVSGVRKCGPFPWNPQAVSFLGKSSAVKRNDAEILNNDEEGNVQRLKQGLEFLNYSIGKEKYNLFSKSID